MLQSHRGARPRADRPHARPARGRRSSARPTWSQLCEDLLSGRGEASGVALAREILARYAELTTGPRIAFFEALASRFGPDRARLDAAVAAWRARPPTQPRPSSIAPSEPRRLELFRRLNLAPGGTAALVRMREQLLDAHGSPRRSRRRRRRLSSTCSRPGSTAASWCCAASTGRRRRICWKRSSATRRCTRSATGTICARRIDSPDRRCYAFFHPALIDEPLIFVEVALTRGIPGGDRADPVRQARARSSPSARRRRCSIRSPTASAGWPACRSAISSSSRWSRRSRAKCRGCRPSSRCRRRRTSPNGSSASARTRRRWRSARRIAPRSPRSIAPDWWRDRGGRRDGARAAAARGRLVLSARAHAARHAARFGRALPSRQRRAARAAQLRSPTRRSGRCGNRYGLMVNYLYDLEHIEKNHEAYAQQHAVVAASAVTRLVRAPARDVVPVED